MVEKPDAGVMLITGGVRGIGAATAKAAAREGYAVCVNYSRSKDSAKELVGIIRAEGGTAISVQADVSIESEIINLFNEVDKQLGTITVLVNNAGINLPSIFSELESVNLRRMLAVNVEGTMIASREAVRRMAISAGGNGGTIINISSISSRSGGGKRSVVYAATKGLIDTFTLGLAREYAKDGIRVCAVRPGMTETSIFDNVDGIEEARKVAAEIVPMGRMARPKEIAAMVIWLCSDAASYVTGLPMDVSGGR